MLQDAVRRLHDVGGQLSDELDAEQLAQATASIDLLSHPLSAEDIRALMLLLPSGGDTASGLNWTILHAIEASPVWPLWDTLRSDENEWVRILRLRLANAGLQPPI
jgi:hypothetical protein